jgi:integrase
VETILTPLIEEKINVYKLLDKFVGFLIDGNRKLSYRSIYVYIAGVKSYLEFNDVDISPNKFKKMVTLPSKQKRNKQAIDAEDIRVILSSCTNTRLKALLLVLASSGMRVGEALSLRNSDVNFDVSPAKIHIRAENTKTKQERDVYVSDEARRELKKFIDSRYGNNDEYRKHPNHLIFPKRSLKRETVNPRMLYVRVHDQFTKLLEKVEMDKRNDGQLRRKVTFHTLRTFVKSTIATHTNTDFSEFYLGHSYSTYWNVKENEIKELYLKCMKFLTFLDFYTVESVGKDFEAKLEQSNKQIFTLQDKISKLEQEKSQMEALELRHTTDLKKMDEKIDKLMVMYSKNPKLAKIKPEVLKKKLTD